ncbi:MAG: PadR family transcriptional regulator, partial [Gemmatimonadota bacterium]
MSKSRDDWGFGEFFAGFGPFGKGSWGGMGRGSRRGRHQIFESGEVKFVILRLLKEKPMHGYEVIKAL